MRTLNFLPILLVAVALMAACGRTEIAQEDDGTLVLGNSVYSKTDSRGVIPGGRSIVIQGTNGNVDIVGTNSTSASLDFTVVARGSSDDAAQRLAEKITVEEVGDETSYTFSVDTPSPELSSVNVTARIPIGTELRIEMRSGNVQIVGVDGPVTTGLMNGSIKYAGSSDKVTMRTRNGDVSASFLAARANSRAVLNTSNGDIVLALPGNAAAKVETATSSGIVRTQGLTFSNQALDPTGAGSKFRGTLGGGGATIESKTFHGDIYVKAISPAEAAAIGMAVQAAGELDDTNTVETDSTVIARPDSIPAALEPAPAETVDTLAVVELDTNRGT